MLCLNLAVGSSELGELLLITTLCVPMLYTLFCAAILWYSTRLPQAVKSAVTRVIIKTMEINLVFIALILLFFQKI